MSTSIYVIEWYDAWSNGDSYYTSDTKCEPMLIVDVGFVCEENDEGVLLAASNCPDDKGLRHIKFIPHGMIKSISEVDYV